MNIFLGFKKHSMLRTSVLLLGIIAWSRSADAQSPAAHSGDKQIIAKGESLFQQNCATCHNFQQKGIGPNLAGVPAETSPEWLLKFIRNPAEIIQSGDPRAKALFAEYKTTMPPFASLSDAEIQSILAFINTNKKVNAVAEDAKLFGPAIIDPIPVKIPKSGLTLKLEEVTTAPATSDKVPLARINQMRVLPGKTDRVFIEDLRGRLYELKNKQLHVVMDISKHFPAFMHAPGHANGFGSFAFHPDFYQNGLFYTTHTEKPSTAPADYAYADSIRVFLQWVLTEWKIKDPRANVFTGISREMLRINMVSQAHGVQEIIFNPLSKPGSPDYGLLYIGVGDGGAAENGYSFLCNTNTQIWSSVLRIDPRGINSKNRHYGIPAINPFAEDNDPNTLGEIFARGFRNPNRISWTADGKMLIGEIGFVNVEELNIGKIGADYGWPAREGTFLLNYRGVMNKVYALPKDDRKYNYTYPVAQFDHDEGKAFSAGFVYTGDIPLLKGKYIFGDIVGGRVFFVENSQLALGKQAPIREFDIDFEGKIDTFENITGNKKSDLRFGIGANNQFYIYTKTDGKIWKVIACSASKNP